MIFIFSYSFNKTKSFFIVWESSEYYICPTHATTYLPTYRVANTKAAQINDPLWNIFPFFAAAAKCRAKLNFRSSNNNNKNKIYYKLHQIVFLFNKNGSWEKSIGAPTWGRFIRFINVTEHFWSKSGFVQHITNRHS